MGNYKIITIEKNQSFISLDTLVKFSGNAEDSIKRLVKKHESKIEELSVGQQVRHGNVGFSRYTSGLNKGKIIWSEVKFNEPQAGFLLSLMDNTEQIVDFKFNLQVEIQRFKEERDKSKALSLPQTYLEALKALTIEVEQKQLALATVAKQSALAKNHGQTKSNYLEVA